MSYQAFLTQVKQHVRSNQLKPLKLFISYAWEGDATATSWLQERLTRLRDDFQAIGLEVFFDLSAMGGKSDIVETMRKHLSESDVVLAICTPMFGSRVQNQQTNVGYEYQQTLKKLEVNSSSVIPLWLAGTRAQSIPKELQTLDCIDCRDTLGHECQLIEALLPRLMPELSLGILWKDYKQTQFGGKPPSIMEKIKSLIPTLKYQSDANPELVMPNIISDKKISHTLLAFLLQLCRNTQQVTIAGKTTTINVIFEHQSEFRDVYWSEALSQSWQELTRAIGVLPLYVPLNQVAVGSKNIPNDWLAQNGFTATDIAALKNHYAILLILSGYETRIKARELNVLQDSRFQEWHGQAVILCDAEKQKDATFIDSYLQSINCPKAHVHSTIYAAVPLELMQAQQGYKSSHGFQEKELLEAGVSARAVTLTERDVMAHWNRFLKNINSIKSLPLSVYLSKVNSGELTPRLSILQHTLLGIGLSLSAEIVDSDIIISICSPEYLAAIKGEKEQEYTKIKTALQNPNKTVYPLWFSGDSFAESVPAELFKLLVRDCRDMVEDYFQWGSLDSPLGLIPSLLDIRLGTAEGALYLQHWQVFRQAVWGKQGQPSGLLHKLKIFSRQMAKSETLYQSTKRYYQDPQVRLSKEGDTSGNLDDFLQQLLTQAIAQTSHSQHPVHLLFAESGSGKSMSILRLEEELWKNFHQYHLVPIRIPLNQINPQKTDFITHWLHDKSQYNTSEIKQLQQLYRFMILLDGYDEFVFSHGEHNIIGLANLSAWPGVTLLTCRTQLEQQAVRFQQGGSRRYLCPFTTTQIDAYLATQAKDKPELTEELRQQVHVLPGLIELITNPLILYITTDILPDLAQIPVPGQEKLTRYALYERFNHKWFLREFVRAVNQGLLKIASIDQQQLQQQLLYYAHIIAVMMFQEGTLIVSQNKLDVNAKQLLREALLDDEQSQQTAIATLRNACPLKLIGDSYQFIHKSFQEFLVAQRLLNVLPLRAKYVADPSDSEFFQQQLMQLETNLWNSLALKNEPAVLDFLRDAKLNQYRLLQVICQSKDNVNIAQASGNALTAYVYAGFSASSLNLENISIENADVTSGIFSYSDMNHSQWKNVVALNTQWVGADLAYAKMQLDFCDSPIINQDNGVSGFCAYKAKSLIAIALAKHDYANGTIDNHILIYKCPELKTIAKIKLGKHIASCMSFSDDGNYLLLTCSGSKSVTICNITSHHRERKIKNVVVGFGWFITIQGDNLFVNGKHNAVSMINWKVGKKIKNFGRARYESKCAAVNGDYLAIGNFRVVELWSIASASLLKRFEFESGLASCPEAIIFYNNYLVMGTDSGDILMWDIQTTHLIRTLKGHLKDVTYLTYYGNQIISGSKDETIRIWDSQTGVCTRVITKHNNSIKGLNVMGHVLYAVDDNSNLSKTNFLTTALIKNHVGHVQRVNSIELRGDVVMSASDDNTVKFWSFETGKLLKEIKDTGGPYLSIRFAALYNNYVVTAGYPDIVFIWDKETAKVITNLSSNSKNKQYQEICALSVANERVFLARMDQNIYIHNLQDGKLIQKIKCRGDVSKLCIDRNILAVAEGFPTNAITLWNMTNWQKLYSFPNISSVTSMVMNERYILAGTENCDIYVICKQAQQILRKIQHPTIIWGLPVIDCGFFPGNANLIFIIYSNGEMMLHSLSEGDIKDFLPLPDKIVASSVDLLNGRIILGLENGTVMSAAVPPPRYFNSCFAQLPRWQFRWQFPAAPTNFSFANTENTEFVDETISLS